MTSNFSYKISKKCYLDIDMAIGYIVGCLKQPDVAKNLYDSIIAKIYDVCKFPMLNHDSKYYDIDDETIRYIKVKNYLLFYHVNKSKKNVVFIRFLYSMSDVKSNLRGSY